MNTRTGLLRQQLGSYYHSCVISVCDVVGVKEGSNPRRRGVEHVGKAAVESRVVRLRASGRARQTDAGEKMSPFGQMFGTFLMSFFGYLAVIIKWTLRRCRDRQLYSVCARAWSASCVPPTPPFFLFSCTLVKVNQPIHHS